ncbi:MAG: DUF5666 domain-containing protein [Betaproteobacteria bacterium]
MPTDRPIHEVLPAALSRRTLLAAAAASSASALLAACGGGGSDEPETATATASSYTDGVIAGFGSVIVGGVRFDDTKATLSTEEGTALAAGALRLGMTVEIDSGRVDRAAASALALRIRLNSELLGPVGAVDTAAGTVVVLGQTVLVTTSTVFDDTLAGGLAALTAGRIVEVYGIPDPANARIVATRIEAEDAAPAYKLSGRIASLNTTARTFAINGQVVNYAGVPTVQVPPGLADGQAVRVRLQTAQVAGQWVATAMRGGRRWPESIVEAKLEGLITAFASTASFSVNGLPVNASAATFPDGTTGLGLGARVEVSGSIVAGVMQATTVEIEERRVTGPRIWDLRGEVGQLNTTAKTFALRGITVWYGGAVEFRDGTEASLANGARVRVRGPLAADRTRLEATRIDFNV